MPGMMHFGNGATGIQFIYLIPKMYINSRCTKMSGKNKNSKNSRNSSTKDGASSKQLLSKKVADNGGISRTENTHLDSNNESVVNPGIAVTPARGDQGTSNPSYTTTQSNLTPPVQSVIHLPNTPGGTEEFSTLATLPQLDLPSTETIKQFTTMHIFPIVKFYTKGTTDTLLDWKQDENSMCQFVLRGCNVPVSRRRDYWPVASIIIHKKLTTLRNDRPIHVRKAFFGK